MDKDELEALLTDGMSVQAIAARFGCAPSTVAKWLMRHGLRQPRTQRLRAQVVAPGDRCEMQCAAHGATTFQWRADGGWRCLRCRSEAVSKRRREVKRILVAEAGGACARCGFREHPAALGFHHVNPSMKRFSLSQDGVSRSLARAREEAAKCVLLCANCHAMVEAGVAILP